MKNRFTSRSPWCRAMGPVLILLAAFILPSCGSDNSSGLPNVPRGDIVIDVDPNPVIGVQGITGVVSAAYLVRIREVNGLGGEIRFISSTVFDPANGRQVGLNYFDDAALKVFHGSSRIEPNGELDVAQTVSYALTEARIDAGLSVAVQFQDDRGSVINTSFLVPIIPPPPVPE